MPTTPPPDDTYLGEEIVLPHEQDTHQTPKRGTPDKRPGTVPLPHIDHHRGYNVQLPTSGYPDVADAARIYDAVAERADARAQQNRVRLTTGPIPGMFTTVTSTVPSTPARPPIAQPPKPKTAAAPKRKA